LKTKQNARTKAEVIRRVEDKFL